MEPPQAINHSLYRNPFKGPCYDLTCAAVLCKEAGATYLSKAVYDDYFE
jgi:hypothetical protein